ncbi:histidine phosphatase family protein [Virgibacillus sp. MSP4-1]|uniref:histidine phosphatase family protein n=1 Tax=Virgibacillus sp. MSP4-1 TaxID=2700081 RepID=UPI0003A99220|nr:histidine phosphatase family protein [Virgibacillus sp. MSP4-1]QHS21848.1 histidine phosphatase family protein [Virgibacillus sp. MSP4-1]
MTTLGFIRHGITEWNATGRAQGISDVPLNEIGRSQALKAGKRLSREEEWDMIITSDLSRAIETGSIIGREIKVPIHHHDPRIREKNCGEVEGTTEEERLQKWGRNWRELGLGMETDDEIAKRGTEFVEEISAAYKGKRILVVSHGLLLGLTLKRLLPNQWEKPELEHTSVTILEYKDDKWDCSLYNCTKHLNDTHTRTI